MYATTEDEDGGATPSPVPPKKKAKVTVNIDRVVADALTSWKIEMQALQTSADKASFDCTIALEKYSSIEMLAQSVELCRAHKAILDLVLTEDDISAATEALAERQIAWKKSSSEVGYKRPPFANCERLMPIRTILKARSSELVTQTVETH